MLNKSVAKRYAEALFSIAREEDNIDKYQEDFKKVIDTIEQIDGFGQYLADFLIPAAEKKSLISKVFAHELSVNMLNFIFVIINKKREAYLELIYEVFVELADESRNIKKAELYTAKEVSSHDLAALAENLSQATGKTIHLQQKIEPDLIAGIKIRIGDKIIDATVKKRLQILSENLKYAKIS